MIKYCFSYRVITQYFLSWWRVGSLKRLEWVKHYTKNPPRRRLLHRAAGNSTRLPFKEEISHCSGSGTPLSKAIHSAIPKPRFPWTVVFLNRVREKRRLLQQFLPPLAHDTSTPNFWCSGNISKATDRRSPSILEFLKYHGGSTPRKVHE